MRSADYPALLRAAESASATAQKTHYRVFQAFTVLSVAGAGLAVYGIESQEAAVAAAILLVGALWLSIVLAVKRFESTWYSARAVAESTKTNVWRLMMHAEPYMGDDRSAQNTFRTTLREILAEHRNLGVDIAGVAADADQITKKMLEVRAQSREQRRKYYETYRIDEQRDWYGIKAGYNKRAASWWFWSLVCLQAGAVVFSLARVLKPDVRYWPTEIFVVAAAGVLGWTQTKRFRELAAAYALTAQEIGLAKSELAEADSDQAFSRIVNETENAFSREHTQWIARRE